MNTITTLHAGSTQSHKICKQPFSRCLQSLTQAQIETITNNNKIVTKKYKIFDAIKISVIGVKMFRVLVIVTSLLGEIVGQEVSGDDQDDRTKDPGGDDIDFSRAVLDPDTGLMCVHNPGTGATFRSGKYI